ncbi:MAG: orotate phosphoribosyltransferase [Gammaproteobacteria bacterium]|nr:orotate phosphoribosyltransferase [Gammaproteobacteria bacterium]MCW5583617.1 orotate phosphoribosyltransferase [Gammaproteobacteria bacterium]
MLKETLITSLYQIHAIQFGEFTLKSGQISSVYLNLRKIISYPPILRNIAAVLWENIHDRPFDLVCGVPYTALPIATCISLEHNVPMIMRRKEKKDYGTKQLIEGEFQPGQSCLIIEDVITTGSSIIETATELENAGLHIHDIIALIDREQGGKENLAKKYQVHSIFTLSEILHFLLQSNVVNPTERHLIDQFLMERMTK